MKKCKQCGTKFSPRNEKQIVCSEECAQAHAMDIDPRMLSPREQFKKLYHHARKVNFEFQQRLNNSNWPCGYDDMMCEEFRAFEEEWLKDKPAIAYAFNNRYEITRYEDKAEQIADARRWKLPQFEINKIVKHFAAMGVN